MVDWIVKSIFLVKEILTIQFTAKVMYPFTSSLKIKIT